MQHVINIAFDFDDDKIRKIAEEKVAWDMDDIIMKAVLDVTAPLTKKGIGVIERDYTYVYSRLDAMIAKFIAEYKDEILERAALKLVDNVKKTKVWREKYREVLNETD